MGRSRGVSPRCIGCRLHPDLCLCPDLGPVAVRTRVAVVMHHREWVKPTNTGHLVRRLLAGAEIRIRGLPGEPSSAAGLALPGRRTLLLYPHPEARPLDAALVAEDPRPVTLVVPDGNWRQARKVGLREPGLESAERVRLGPGDPTRFALRRHRRAADSLCTLEAVARALGVLEGAGGPEVEARLEAVVDAWVARTLYTRGRAPRPELQRDTQAT